MNKKHVFDLQGIRAQSWSKKSKVLTAVSRQSKVAVAVQCIAQYASPKLKPTQPNSNEPEKSLKEPNRYSQKCLNRSPKKLLPGQAQ